MDLHKNPYMQPHIIVSLFSPTLYLLLVRPLPTFGFSDIGRILVFCFCLLFRYHGYKVLCVSCLLSPREVLPLRESSLLTFKLRPPHTFSRWAVTMASTLICKFSLQLFSASSMHNGASQGDVLNCGTHRLQTPRILYFLHKSFGMHETLSESLFTTQPTSFIYLKFPLAVSVRSAAIGVRTSSIDDSSDDEELPQLNPFVSDWKNQALISTYHTITQPRIFW